MKKKISFYWKNFIHFFPLKLLILHIKSNYLLTGFWLLLFLTISSNFGEKYGIPNLMLVPEYQHGITFSSFFFMGMITGAFIMAFNVSSYELNSHRFPFIATLARPFYKYTINNFTIPFIYLVYYSYQSAIHQTNWEFISEKNIIFNLLSFWLGTFLFIGVSFLIFFYINRHSGLRFLKIKETKLARPIQKMISKEREWRIKNRPVESVGFARVETYMFSPFKLRKARNFGHYSQEILNRVFEKTHRNATYYALLIISFIVIRSVFSDIPLFNFPAGGSIILALTILLLFFSAIHSFAKEWSFFYILAIVLLLNIFSPYFAKYNYNAYGMDYSMQETSCDMSQKFSTTDFFDDYSRTLKILQNWKKKNTLTAGQKPKMVIINASGGGMKMAIWAYLALSKADNALDGQLFKHCMLITGSSGGMLGMAYLRELYLRQMDHQIKNYYNDTLLAHLERDMLNPIMYRLSSGDWFFRLRKFQYRGHKYFVDRAYAFEKTLNKHTFGVLNKPLVAYRKPEFLAKIPMMILSPVILNDGRQLLISPQGLAYMIERNENFTENIDFLHAYRHFNSDSLRFTTAIRMNASFPYISPVTILPGNPQLATIDAGLRDNLGYGVALQFIHVFRRWIETETSGVIILQLYENEKLDETTHFDMLDKILKPAGSVYNNMYKIQELNNLRLSNIINKELDQKISVIPLRFGNYTQKISLSWHLSSLEKKILHESVYSPDFKRQIIKLKFMLQ